MRPREWFKRWRREEPGGDGSDVSAGGRRLKVSGRTHNFWTRRRQEEPGDQAARADMTTEVGPLSHGLF